MTSRSRLSLAGGEFDETLRAVLRESVLGEEPSARVRRALLRAAANRRQPVDTPRSAMDQGLVRHPRYGRLSAWREWEFQAAAHSLATQGMLQAHLLKLRLVM